MNDAAKTTRELLEATDLFGFDTGRWARGLADGRRAVARRGAKERASSLQLDEDLLLQTLNAPIETAEAVEAPVAEQSAETA